MLAPIENGQEPARDTRFKAGNVANPKGRPKGSRSKLGTAFLDALYEDFSEHGSQAIKNCRDTNPAAYLKVCASIIPQDVTVTHKTVFDDMDANELSRLVNALSAESARLIGSGSSSIITQEVGTVQTISEAEIIP